ncbi:hypothetical protein [Flexithrix dorotheae]|uniref:hypothetical protein n=1 Tax=Flexithrix dorotheae TaxID=70993 RepID=UPI00037980EB|nr:hypothetical protein [Flexithrix dorotheae]
MDKKLEKKIKDYLYERGYHQALVNQVIKALTQEDAIKQAEFLNRIIGELKNFYNVLAQEQDLVLERDGKFIKSTEKEISQALSLQSEMLKTGLNKFKESGSVELFNYFSNDQILLFSHIIAEYLKQSITPVIRHGHELFKVYARKQLNGKQLSIFSAEQTPRKVQETELFNKKIDELLTSNQAKNPSSISRAIDLPPIFENNMPSDVLQQVSRDFSENEVKSIHAIVGLVNKAIATKDIEYVKNLDLVVLEFDLGEYYNLYGLVKKKEKDGKFRFDTRAQDRAKQGLLELHNREFILPNEKTVVSKKSTKTIREINIKKLVDIKGIKIVEEQKTGHEKIILSNSMKLTLDGVFLRDLQKNYFKLPKYLNKEIVDAMGGKRISPAIQLFVVNLFAHAQKAQTNTIEQNYETLIPIMRLENYAKNGRKGIIKKRISQGIECAMKIGILKNFEEGRNKWGGLKYIFHVNLDYFKFNQEID